MTIERDSDHFTEQELLMRYGRCPACGSARCCEVGRDDDQRIYSMGLVCTNTLCHLSPDWKPA